MKEKKNKNVALVNSEDCKPNTSGDLHWFFSNNNNARINVHDLLTKKIQSFSDKMCLFVFKQET